MSGSAAGNAVVYIVSAAKFLALSLNDAQPGLLTFEH